MNFIDTEIKDVIIIEPNKFEDNRGYFSETFRLDLLEKKVGYKLNFVQDNESKSSIGVFRGMHYQLPPFAQTKLVRVIEGSVIDFAIDIRKGSPTYLQSVSVELSKENGRQLFVPRGFAHGFLVTSETATFQYKVDNYYNKDSDRSIYYDDDNFDLDLSKFIDIQKIIISEKDSKEKSNRLEDVEIFEYKGIYE